MSEEAVPERIGDYVIERVLGEGGMAKVYQARHAILDSRHAIKVLDPSYRANPVARQRFLDEAKIQASQLDHPNIVKVVNIVATSEHAALVMELIEGVSLEDRIGDLKNDPALLKQIMLDVLDAVGYAHDKGVIHRDLKPANVLLAKKGSQLIPKVTDFGIAKITGGGVGKKSTHADARMGTLTYSSPEQFRSAKDVTPRSDVFSLGAMLYEIATGQSAFPGDNDYDVMDAIVKGRFTPPEQHHPGIDPTIAAVIKKALEPDPQARYGSCREMADALKGASAVPVRTPAPAPAPAPLPAPAPPPFLVEEEVPSVKPTGRGARLAMIGGGAVLAIAAVLFITQRGGGAKKTTAGARVPIDASVVASAPPVDAFVPPDEPEPVIDAPLPPFDVAAGQASLAAVAKTIPSCKRQERQRGDMAGVVIISLTFDPTTGALVDSTDKANDSIFDPREGTCILRRIEAAPSVPPFSGPKKTITRRVIVPPRGEPID